MKSVSRRRRGPAMLPWERIGWLRFKWLHQYAGDPEFRSELTNLCACRRPAITALANERAWRNLRFYCNDDESIAEYLSQFGADSENVEAYLTAVEELVEDKRLNLLLDGRLLIHDWCTLHIGDPSIWPIESFPAGAYHMGGARAEVGEVVSREEFSVLGPGDEGFRVVDERREPRMHITFDDVWRANEEPRSEARKRLLVRATEAIDSALDDIEEQYEQAGYVVADTQNKLHDHLWMTYRRYVYSERYSYIADQYNSRFDGRVTADAVRKAVRSRAADLGLPATPDEFSDI